MEVEVEGDSTGEDWMLPSRHAKYVQQVTTEPSRIASNDVLWWITNNLVKDAGLRPSSLAPGISR